MTNNSGQPEFKCVLKHSPFGEVTRCQHKPPLNHPTSMFSVYAYSYACLSAPSANTRAMGDKGEAKFFQVTDQQPRSGFLHSYSSTEIISLFPSNIGAERCNVLNQKALNCLRTQQLAPTDTILYLDH